MSRCPICNSEVYHTVSREWDICINNSAHGGQAYFLKRRVPRPEFEFEVEPEVQPNSCPRGGNCDE